MLATIQKNNAFFRQLLFIAGLVVIGLIIFKQLQFFVGSALGATTLYVVFRNLLFRMTEVWRIRRWVAALILVAICSVLLAAIGYVIFALIASEIPSFDTSGIVAKLNELILTINEKTGYTIVPENLISQSGGIVARLATSIFNTTYSFAANVFMMIVILYFMFVSGRRMEGAIFKYSPFKGKSQYLLRREVKTMIYSNAVVMPVIMIFQTLAATLIYWLVGMPNVWFWGFLTAICGLIPIVGTGLVFVPLAIYYIAVGDVLTAVIIAAYGVLVISNIDNLIRIIFMKSVANTHPLVVVFGVILGVPLFGFWGIIFGPLLISGFLLLIKIYYVEYGLLTPVESVETFNCDEAAEASLASQVAATMAASVRDGVGGTDLAREADKRIEEVESGKSEEK